MLVKIVFEIALITDIEFPKPLPPLCETYKLFPSATIRSGPSTTGIVCETVFVVRFKTATKSSVVTLKSPQLVT